MYVGLFCDTMKETITIIKARSGTIRVPNTIFSDIGRKPNMRNLLKII